MKSKVLTAGDIMTAVPKTISVNEKVMAAKKIMAAHSIRHLPVMEKNEVVGVVSDRDIKIAQAVYSGPGFNENVLMREVCIFSPVSVKKYDSISVVLSIMSKRKLGSVLVVHERKLVGIITTVDVCRAFARMLKEG